MKHRTDPSPPHLTVDQIRQILAAEKGGENPNCFLCGAPVTSMGATVHYGMEEETRVVTLYPCGHRWLYNLRVAEQLDSEMRAAATEATESAQFAAVDVHLGDREGLDRERRYLRPVAEYGSGEVHLSVYGWLPMFEAWATGMSLCGQSMRQGPLLEGTAVTCASCLEYQPKYERYLAPGYQPGDDDPETLRREIGRLKAEVAAARKFAGEMRDFCSPHGVSVDYADRLLEAMDRAKEGAT